MTMTMIRTFFLLPEDKATIARLTGRTASEVDALCASAQEMLNALPEQFDEVAVAPAFSYDAQDRPIEFGGWKLSFLRDGLLVEALAPEHGDSSFGINLARRAQYSFSHA